MDWNAIYEECIRGTFMDLLVKLSRERWAERDEDGHTLLHYAGRGPNVTAVVALVKSGLVDMNARDKLGHTPTRFSAIHMQHRVIEVMCAMGADLRAIGNSAPIECALVNAQNDDGATTRVLVANGIRLSTARERYHEYITPELVAFEQGVMRCRIAVVAMLRVKKAGNLWRWDKFLLREMAYAIWTTRYEKEW